MNPRFHLHGNCQIVVGPKFSLIIDLYRSRYIRIPSQLVDTIRDLGNTDLAQLRHEYGPQGTALVSFVRFLEQNDYGFWTAEPERFPSIDDEWLAKSHITNAVVDLISKVDPKSLSVIFSTLDALLCRAVLFRVQGLVDAHYLGSIRQASLESYCSHVEVECSELIWDDELEHVLDMSLRIRAIRPHRSPDRVIGDARIQEKTPHTVHESSMIFNMEFFLESGKHNAFLNHKAYIDPMGNFSNIDGGTPFGNIHQMNIEEVIKTTKSAAFRKYWNVATTQIHKCRTCEYRRSCYNPQIPELDEGGEWHYRTMCAYDPDSGTWKESTKGKGFETVAQSDTVSKNGPLE